MNAPILHARLRIPKVKAIRRPRLDDLLDGAWSHRLTMVLAPAGSGKTTAVAELALRSTQGIGWFAATGCDGSVASFVGYVNSSLNNADDRVPLSCTTIDEIANALEQLDGQIGLVIDDVHTLFGTPAERSLEELIDRVPEQCRIILTGRREPGFDLSRLRLAGQVLAVGADELRFRSWEAEQLFRELYETWLRPDDIARLSHRVEGWAAGLQLFHLAARNMPPAEQRRLIERLNGQARLVRDYLAANVLEPIASELRAFLIDTCVLGVVTPALADELRQSTGSGELLRELAQGHLFTVAVDDDTYRYHEVLRAQLEVLLHERDGPREAAQRYSRAAPLLERDGFIYDALRCYAHAGDWEAVRRIASPASGELPPARSHWVAELPPSIVADDPWLLLARARAEVSGGQFRAAVATFQQAELRAVGGELAEACRAQRALLVSWLDPAAHPPDGWPQIVRQGVRRNPLEAAEALEATSKPLAIVAAAVLRLAAGDGEDAIAVLSVALRNETMNEGTFSIGLVALALARLIVGGDDRQGALDEAEALAETAGMGWAARLARAGLALTARATGADEARRVSDLCIADGDPWGAGFAALLGGLGAARSGADGSDMLRRAAASFRGLEAFVFENIATAVLAHTTGSPSSEQLIPDEAVALFVGTSRHAAGVGPAGAVEQANDAGERAGAPLRVNGSTDSPLLAAPAISPVDRRPAVRSSVAGPPPTRLVGAPAPPPLQPPVLSSASVAIADAPPPPLEVRCLGSFQVLVNGEPLPLHALRPRARALLRLLAINVGSSIHRESLVEALWPEGDADTGVHNLQVAVSAVRKTLADAGVSKDLGVVRHGEAYRLALHRLDASDHVRFLDAVKRAKAALSRGDETTAFNEATKALHEYGGELLHEDGPAEWVVSARSRAATQHEAAAVIVAKSLIARGEFAEAIELCESVIHERPFADEVWRLLVQSQRERGDLAAAAQAQSRYDKMLAGLNS